MADPARSTRRIVNGPVVCAAGVALAAGLVALWAGRVDAELDRPRDLHGAPHATSAACQRCHPGAYESWSETFHRTMTQEATESAVLGDFNAQTFSYGGIEARMRRGEAGAFEMVLTGPEGELARFTVERTVGSHHIQQYLARDGDVYVRLPMAWQVEEGRWFHMNGAFLTPDPDPPPDGARITSTDYMRHVVRWNDNCVFCHNVAANPGARGDAFETEVAELGVACEACHGPAEEHARVNTDPVRRYTLHLDAERADPTIVHPARLQPERSAELCGRCHGQRITDDVGAFLRDGDPYVPGERLSRYSRPLTRETTLNGEEGVFAARFWPDGTPRLTAYEFQGLLQSPCTDLTCTDCHGMHEGSPAGQMRPAMEGDRQCVACHADDGHDGHRRTACIDCHMPEVVYGLVGARRSHRIELPRPDVEARPDACSLCHADRSPRWIAAGYGRLYGEPVAGEDGAPQARVDAIAGDPVMRAVSMEALGRLDGLRSETARRERTGIVLDAMDRDRYPAVRRIAWRSLRALMPDASDDWDGYVPTADVGRRRAWTEAVRRRLGSRVILPPDGWVTTLRARAAEVDIDIGE
ncbi:MAG: multiheme c-type cytochrome [Sandaracinaceae bacterium]